MKSGDGWGRGPEPWSRHADMLHPDEITEKPPHCISINIAHLAEDGLVAAVRTITMRSQHQTSY
jgi:hypothetical protein